MWESRPSEEAIALFTNVFGYAPDPEALHAGECWQAERIDAALRRAKAEVWKEAALYVTELIVKPVGILDADTIFAIQDLLDARAAQIEEGE